MDYTLDPINCFVEWMFLGVYPLDKLSARTNELRPPKWILNVSNGHIQDHLFITPASIALTLTAALSASLRNFIVE